MKLITKLTREERNVLLTLVLAQTGSDSGKGYYESYRLRDSRYRTAEVREYADKLVRILKAIRTLRGIPGGSKVINYWVDPESLITYFDILLETDETPLRLQISFHTPEHVPGYEKLVKLAGTGRKTKWTGEIGGSSWACHILGQIV